MHMYQMPFNIVTSMYTECDHVAITMTSNCLLLLHAHMHTIEDAPIKTLYSCKSARLNQDLEQQADVPL